MESFLRRIAIIFILCMVAVILIFIGINYKANESAKKIKNTSQQELNKENKSDKKKSTNKDNKSKKDSINKENSVSEKDSTNNLDKSIDDSDDNISNNTTNSVIDNSSTGSNHNSDSYYDNSFIPVTKFSARINNNTLYIGENVNITTTIYPSNATIQDVSYSSSNKNIAIVSKDGVVTGVNVGECYITVSVKNAGSGQLKVYVLPSDNTTYKYENN